MKTIKVKKEKFTENAWSGVVVATAFESLQDAAYKCQCSIEDMLSCNVDPETDAWLENIRDALAEIDEAVIDIDEAGNTEGYIVTKE